MRYLIIFIFLLFSLKSYGITKVYNLIDEKLTIHTTNPLTKDQKNKIKDILDNITAVLDVTDSDSFVSRFNNLEKNSEVSAPDVFVDAYKVLNDYNKITKGKFDPTAFTLLSKSQKVKKLNYYLKSGVHSRCTSLKNIKIKINNVFSKKEKCTKISFNSLIYGKVVDEIQIFFDSEKINAYAIIFNNVVAKKNFSFSEISTLKLSDYIKEKVNFDLINNFGIYELSDNLYIHNINMKDENLILNDEIIILVSTSSNSNNNILANTLNLMDFDKIKNLNNSEVKIPIFILYKIGDMYNFSYTDNFKRFLSD
tara:strand:- start:88 stop:1017 length:930 start_codon:yes stop_codon:yes gene_type:complete